MWMLAEVLLIWLCTLWRGSSADGAFSATFNNLRSHAVELRWDDGTADGVEIVSVGALETRNLNTFNGHVIKASQRSQNGELRTISQFRMSDTNTQYTIPPEPASMTSSSVGASDEAQTAMSSLRAYTRSVDFLHQRPSSRTSVAMTVVIKNFRTETLRRYWDDGSEEGVYQGDITGLGINEGITTYTTHVFNIFKESTGRRELVAKFKMTHEQRVYIIEPEPGDTETLRSPAYLNHLEETKFRSDYEAHHGVPWLGGYPPIVPNLYVHKATGLGTRGFFVPIRAGSRPDGMKEDMSIELISLSAGPPEGPVAFLIEKLLTHEECDHIISFQDRLRRSQVGTGVVAKTRSSESVFINKHQSRTLELIHRRFADVLNVTDADLDYAAEDLQVVRYKEGQEYSPHYDFSGRNDRLATLLVYVSEPDEAGGTSFPAAFGDRGLVVRPPRGSGVLFYSRTPDGNLDELSLHAGMPVAAGVKMVCNLWLHARGGKRARHDEL